MSIDIQLNINKLIVDAVLKNNREELQSYLNQNLKINFDEDEQEHMIQIANSETLKLVKSYFILNNYIEDLIFERDDVEVYKIFYNPKNFPKYLAEGLIAFRKDEAPNICKYLQQFTTQE
jgi:hypothetical protein